MATASTNKTSSKKVVNAPVAVEKGMKSHNNDPFFVKKAKQAKALIDKHGLPKTSSR